MENRLREKETRDARGRNKETRSSIEEQDILQWQKIVYGLSSVLLNVNIEEVYCCMPDAVLLGCLPTKGANGDFKTSQDVEVILQSIFVILNTPVGSRPWQPTFGCDIKYRIFDPDDDKTRESIRSDIRSALKQWEPRIEITNLDVVQQQRQVVGVDLSFKYEGNQYTKKIITSLNSDSTVYDLYDNT